MVESDLAAIFGIEGTSLLTRREGSIAAARGVKPVKSALQSWVVILPLSQVLLGYRGEPNACYGIERGAQYDIELVERYDETSSYLDGPWGSSP